MNTNTATEVSMRAAMQRLIAEDAVGQLRRRDGRMAELGSEDGVLKLDWVEAVARLLADPTQLEEVEAEARAIRAGGIRHIIWAGMGGSVLTVRVLRELGFCGGPDANGEPASLQRPGQVITIHPLDSTDPAALNAIVRSIAVTKDLTIPASAQTSGAGKVAPDDAGFLHALLNDVMMIGVSMGVTSEEPITHLTWFTDLLERAGLLPAEHLLVMTLPGSYLDAFAREHQVPSRPLQTDGGTGTGGRMSAPGTRVFLLPAALYLTGISEDAGQLRAVLNQAWDEYNLEQASSHPANHPFVQLAAALSAVSRGGACRLLVAMPYGWGIVVSWLEQLMEESLGKGGKGIVVFDDQALNSSAPAYRPDGLLRVRVVTDMVQAGAQAEAPARPEQTFILAQPYLASTEPRQRLAALAASFLGWQLSMALYGYLHDIHFAGQPAVENYKARARGLRREADPLQVASRWQPALHGGTLTLLAPAGTALPAEQPSTLPHLAAAFASVLRQATSAMDGGWRSRADGRPPARALGYLDVTVNGTAPDVLLSALDERARTVGNTLLGVPLKLRQAPADYHSTEQSEMDGPPYLVSLRLLARETQASLLGSYTNQFLHAQAVSTWQAMMEVGRPCFLLVVDGRLDDAASERLSGFFSQVMNCLEQA